MKQVPPFLLELIHGRGFQGYQLAQQARCHRDSSPLSDVERPLLTPEMSSELSLVVSGFPLDFRAKTRWRPSARIAATSAVEPFDAAALSPPRAAKVTSDRVIQTSRALRQH